MSETTESFMKYYGRRGHAQRGDEETDAFSDNEGEEDTKSVKRERRERVKLLNAAKSSLTQRATQTTGLQSARVAVPSIVDSKGRVGIGLTGVNKVTEATMRGAREINRELESEVALENLNYTDHQSQATIQGLGAKVTFNAIRLLELFSDSKKWKWDGWLALFSFLLGVYLVYYAASSLYSYF